MNSVYTVCFFIFSALLIACESKDSGVGTNSITFLHMGSHRSHLEPHPDFSFEFDNLRVTTEAGGFPRLIEKFKELRNKNKHSFILHSGDAITGNIYYYLFKGQADAAMMNEICFDAMLLGGSETSLAEAGLIRFLKFLKNEKCKTSVLSANIVPKVGVSKLARDYRNEYIRPYVVRSLNNQKIAFIGLSNIRKSINSNLFNAAYGFLDELQAAQGYINLLKKRGISRFILISDQFYSQDMALARNLTDVDVIIGGDSRILLGEFARYGLNNDEPYPSVVKNKDGDKVCVVESWRGSLTLGELNVTFDDKGRVAECDGNMHLLLANKPVNLFDEQGNKLDKASLKKQIYATLEDDEQISLIPENTSSRKVLDAFAATEFRNRAVGKAAEDLCLEWIPDSGQSKLCDKKQTAQRGSDIINIIAQSFLAFIPQADVAIQNAGSVRGDVKKGVITMGDIYNLLPYNNKLVLLQVSGQQVKQLLEDAVDFSMLKTGSLGAYPYAANLRWELYAYKPKGRRVVNVEYKNKKTGGWEPLNEEIRLNMLVNDFISKGSDGYRVLSDIKYEDKTYTQVEYSEAFLAYLRAKKAIQKLHPSDYSTQNYFASPP